jgi:hypothetical protein
MSGWTGLAGFLWALVVGVGPVVLALVLLNRRDHRIEALKDRVAAAIPAEALRSDVGVQVGVGILTGRGIVRLALGAWSPLALWDTIARLRGTLPPAVRLVVEGQDAPREPVRITVERPAGGPLRRAA